eukprot:9083346-Lingulodinium_polyedra.AAC.1
MGVCGDGSCAGCNQGPIKAPSAARPAPNRGQTGQTVSDRDPAGAKPRSTPNPPGVQEGPNHGSTT